MSNCKLCGKEYTEDPTDHHLGTHDITREEYDKLPEYGTKIEEPVEEIETSEEVLEEPEDESIEEESEEPEEPVRKIPKELWGINPEAEQKSYRDKISGITYKKGAKYEIQGNPTMKVLLWKKNKILVRVEE